MFAVKFEDGLSISVLRSKGNSTKKNWSPKPMSFKKFKFSKATTTHLPLVVPADK
jgi:hypothetical protein